MYYGCKIKIIQQNTWIKVDVNKRTKLARYKRQQGRISSYINNICVTPLETVITDCVLQNPGVTPPSIRRTQRMDMKDVLKVNQQNYLREMRKLGQVILTDNCSLYNFIFGLHQSSLYAH